jgi:hypothetical protein
MPCNVRNFWIEGTVDGRKSAIAVGPQRKDGGFSLTIKMRDAGSVLDALRISGWSDGTTVHLSVVNPHRSTDRLEYLTTR